MASGDDFLANTTMDDDWNPSEFMFDSPQPAHQQYPLETSPLQTISPAANTHSQQNMTLNNRQAENKTVPHLAVPQQTYSAPSSASESSSQSSSSESSARRKRKTSSTSSPAAILFGATAAVAEERTPSDYKMDRSMMDIDDPYNFDDTTYPMGTGMGNLSLDSMGSNSMGGTSMPSTFDFATASESPGAFALGPFADNMETSRSFGLTSSGQTMNLSPEMTVQPSKFMIGDPGDDSPNSAHMMTSQENSPFMHSKSPFSGNSDDFGTGFTSNNGFNGMTFNPNALTYTDVEGSGMTPVARQSSAGQNPGAQWPCQLSVDKIPDKSRVETQIPIKLWLSPIPDGVAKLHLPTHTISKPKLLAKPPFEKSSDTLELSTTLVCASAMQKEDVLDRAFARAATDEAPLKKEDIRRNSTGDIQHDENDPNLSENGGPVAICQGCITRERKRAARKKNKKAEEEEAWAKDEAKRVIVFNTNEVKEWQSPSGQGESLAEQQAVSGVVVVEAPMRIACYCRHQNEKVGFQVIFTIKTSDGQVLAQAISASIMITDDHKQPTSHTQAQQAMPVQTNTPFGAGGLFGSGNDFDMMQNISQRRESFKPSWSTNDLQAIRNKFAPQAQSPNFRKQYSAHASSQSRGTSSTMTPRTLSRPASPTDPQGHSQKKRRSGGPGHAKVPSGLTMTRRENTVSPTSISTSQSAMSAGPTSAGFSFGGSYNSSVDAYQQQPMGMGYHFNTGPPTPIAGHGMGSAYASPSLESGPFRFSTAPSSQHASRAPSPTSELAGRMSSNPGQDQSRMLREAANTLAGLPAGFNQERPPSIHQVVPPQGPTTGGVEVTILGQNFCKGLDVMFGENIASTTTYWGETTIVCRLPPSARAGPVPVTFVHEKSGAFQRFGPSPYSRTTFHYHNDDPQQMLALAMRIAQTHNGNAINPDQLTQPMAGYQPNYFSGGGGPTDGGDQQQRSSGHPGEYDVAASENSMMKWLEFMDMSNSPLQPSFNTARPHTGSTLLVLASKMHYIRFAAGLLARGANPDVRDNSGFTPLMFASKLNRHQIARLLVLKGADATIRNLRGDTAADLCASREAQDTLKEVGPVSRQDIDAAAQPFRRPSSTPSVDSFSEFETSSQASGPSAVDDEDHLEKVIQKCSTDRVLTMSGRKVSSLAFGKLTPPVLINPYDQLTSISPTAAWNTWREQMQTHLHHLQQSMQWNIPSLQFPPLPNMPDYQQYSRRLSSMLSIPISPALPPPSYEDACGGPPSDKTFTKDDARLQAAASKVISDMKYKVAQDTPPPTKQCSSAVTASGPHAQCENPSKNNTLYSICQASSSGIHGDSKQFIIWLLAMLLILGCISLSSSAEQRAAGMCSFRSAATNPVLQALRI